MPATFKKGDRVKMTDEAVDQGHAPWGRKEENVYGVVASHQKGLAVRVVRDGTTKPQSYHVGFWDRW